LHGGSATPGALSLATGLVKNANSTASTGAPSRPTSSPRLGREVRLANDANCFALSRPWTAREGSARRLRRDLGTGVARDRVDGRVIAEPTRSRGSGGTTPSDAGEDDLPLPRCYWGARLRRDLPVGPGLAADHRRATGERLDAAGIATRAGAGDAACEATLSRYEARLARALAGVVNIVDPDVIVLGGGLSRVSRLYERVPALWGAHVFSDEVRTRLVPRAHGDSGGVRGAALAVGAGMSVTQASRGCTWRSSRAGPFSSSPPDGPEGQAHVFWRPRRPWRPSSPSPRCTDGGASRRSSSRSFFLHASC